MYHLTHQSIPQPSKSSILVIRCCVILVLRAFLVLVILISILESSFFAESNQALPILINSMFKNIDVYVYVYAQVHGHQSDASGDVCMYSCVHVSVIELLSVLLCCCVVVWFHVLCVCCCFCRRSGVCLHVSVSLLRHCLPVRRAHLNACFIAHFFP